MGGRGSNFRAAGIFFRYQIPCMNFFRPYHEYFLGLIGVQEFFSFNFPLREYIYFFVLRPPPISFLMVRPLLLSVRSLLGYEHCYYIELLYTRLLLL